MATASSRTATAAPPAVVSNDAAMDPSAQCALATVNVLRLLHDSSPCQSLEKLPRDLSGKLPNIRNTGSLLHQMPSVVISLDTHLDSAVHNAALLKDVKDLLSVETFGMPNLIARFSPQNLTSDDSKVVERGKTQRHNKRMR